MDSGTVSTGEIAAMLREKPPETEEIPALLAQHLFDKRGDTLILRDTEARRYGDVVLAIGTWLGLFFVTAGGAMAMAPFIQVSWAGTMAGIVVTVLVGMVGTAAIGGLLVWMVMRDLPLEMDRDGARVRQVFGHKIRKVDKVTLSGEPGNPIRIRIHGEGRFIEAVSIVPSLQGSGWTYPALRWGATRMARQLRVSLEDDLDHKAWARWVGDPVFRLRVEFDEAVEQSREAFPELSKVAAKAPASRVKEDGGMRVGPVHLNDERVKTELTELPLVGIRDVAAQIRKRSSVDPATDEKREWSEASLLVLTEDDVVTMATRKLGDQRETAVAELRWLADRIRRKAAEARLSGETG